MSVAVGRHLAFDAGKPVAGLMGLAISEV